MMHFIPFLFLLATSSLAMASSSSEGWPSVPRRDLSRSNFYARSTANRRHGSFAKIYVLFELAARHPSYASTRDALSEPLPLLALLGGTLRTAGSAMGKGASKVPEKAGRKMAKEQGKNTGQQQQDQAHQQTADMMAGNLKTMGYKDTDPKCLKRMVDTFPVSGGANGNYSRCWKKPPKEEQEREKTLEWARKKMPKPRIPKAALLHRWIGRGNTLMDIDLRTLSTQERRSLPFIYPYFYVHNDSLFSIHVAATLQCNVLPFSIHMHLLFLLISENLVKSQVAYLPRAHRLSPFRAYPL